MAEATLEVPPLNLAAGLRLQQELGISRVLAQVLVRRGLEDPEQAAEFLAAGQAHEPREFAGIDNAVQLVRRHIAAGHAVVVHGDYDVDGICATAIMVRALRGLGAQVSWFLPDRRSDGYGLSAATVARLQARGCRLLVTVDCGITAVEEVAAARRAGIEVLVTDHHAPRADGRLPDCAVVHPGVCRYPCPELCGTAVAFKLAQALGAPQLERELELVALATVADLMPLQGENRRLVRHGLAALANTTAPGLRALMQVSGTDPSELSATALGFRLAPRLNAAGRLRHADAGLELLLSEDAERAREIAQELEALNAERRAVEQRILWQAQAQVTALGAQPAYVLAAEDWHPGVIGIVASRIVERWHRPTLLIALGEAQSGQGSGRSIPGFDLLAGLQAAGEHLLRYGGHRAAAGFTVAAEAIPGLREAFVRHARQVLTPDLLCPVERVDAVACGSELGLELADELARLEPCGMGNPRPRLLVPGARFGDVRAMGQGRHARFSVSSGGARARAVSFGCDGQVPGSDGSPVQATFTLERNVWNGAVEPRLLLRHAEPRRPEPIEVVGDVHPYLHTVLAELDRPLPRSPSPANVAERTVLDRRNLGPLTVLAEILSSGQRTLAVCADVGRRRPGLAQCSGGYALTSYAALGEDPELGQRYPQVVALDPPAGADSLRALRAGPGYAVLAWGQAELRFAQRMHQHEYDLRAALISLYRRLKPRGTLAAEELESALRGDGRHPRSPWLAGRLLRVLSELQLVTVDRLRPALTLVSQEPTSLQRSAAYRVYCQCHEEGRRFLSRGNLPALA